MYDGVPFTVSNYEVMQCFSCPVIDYKYSAFSRTSFVEADQPYLSVCPSYKLSNVVLLMIDASVRDQGLIDFDYSAQLSCIVLAFHIGSNTCSDISIDFCDWFVVDMETFIIEQCRTFSSILSFSKMFYKHYVPYIDRQRSFVKVHKILKSYLLPTPIALEDVPIRRSWVMT